MSDRIPIHKVLKQVIFSRDIELIDVPVEDGAKAITLLRAKEKPELAFVMWAEYRATTMSQIAFRMPDGRRSAFYYVACVCCKPEIFGIITPEKSSSQISRWKKKAADNFKRNLVSLCRANGIVTLFMRKADLWDKRYGAVEGLNVVEAIKHLESYGNKLYLRCIDYDESRGMELRN